MSKTINRESTSATKIFDDRSLAVDYRTLVPILKKGMRVLDVGCGTGSISKDIANAVGPNGKVTGIDNTEKFIESGKQTYLDTKNLELIYTDLFKYESGEKFDLIVSARTMQWLTHVDGALLKLKSLLRDDGTLSILDYNHTRIEWTPEPPASMKKFYAAFLKWREAAGMNNRIGDELEPLMAKAGFKSIEVFNADEFYTRADPNFNFRLGIWSKVALLMQIVEEGYISEEDRVLAIKEYDEFVESRAVSMRVRLNEVRGKNPRM
jgi:ubiquinone/menaquinone biosynthesis C-methylase UbiE